MTGRRPRPGRRQPRAPRASRPRARPSAGLAGRPGPAPALAARLEKRIPVAAGLGGGSSDAAAAIDGALEAWGAELDRPTRRLRVAAGLGSDVPFFLAGAPALVEGRGERVTPLDGLRGAPGRPARDAGRRGRHARRVRGVRRASAARATGPSGCPPSTSRQELRLRAVRGGPRRAGRRPRRGQRPAAAPRPSSLPELVPFRRAAHAACWTGRSACPGRARPSGRSILR